MQTRLQVLEQHNRILAAEIEARDKVGDAAQTPTLFLA
jgi:hypothetical protein